MQVDSDNRKKQHCHNKLMQISAELLILRDKNHVFGLELLPCKRII